MTKTTDTPDKPEETAPPTDTPPLTEDERATLDTRAPGAPEASGPPDLFIPPRVMTPAMIAQLEADQLQLELNKGRQPNTGDMLAGLPDVSLEPGPYNPRQIMLNERGVQLPYHGAWVFFIGNPNSIPAMVTALYAPVADQPAMVELTLFPPRSITYASAVSYGSKPGDWNWQQLTPGHVAK